MKMASWSELVNHIAQLGNNQTEVNDFINGTLDNSLDKVSQLHQDRNVIFYASSFLQKPQLDPSELQITFEEINGLMSVTYGMNCSKGLILILHTPGGVTNATETIIDYIHSKFQYVEVVIPTFAMSAGTMIALSADKIIMGRQSQLGPIDPQMIMNGRSFSANSVKAQFDLAKKDIQEDVKNAHVWAPILGGMPPGLLVEAQHAAEYSEEIVRKWLEKKGYKEAERIASYFNKPDLHKSHGRRINKDEARAQGLHIDDLESSQEFQDAVLTAYHAMTIIFEKSPATKMFATNNNHTRWVKNLVLNNLPSAFQIPPELFKA